MGGGIFVGGRALPGLARVRRGVRPRVGRPRGTPLRVRKPRLRRDARRPGGDRARGRCLAVDGPLAEPHGRARPPRRERRPRASCGASPRPAAGSGIALASTVNVLDVEAVVLGGCFGPLSPWLVADVREDARGALARGPVRTCEVLSSAFGDGAAVRGAAALTLHRGTRPSRGSSPSAGLRPRVCRVGDVDVRAESDAGAGGRWRIARSLAGLDAAFEPPRRTVVACARVGRRQRCTRRRTDVKKFIISLASSLLVAVERRGQRPRSRRASSQVRDEARRASCCRTRSRRSGGRRRTGRRSSPPSRRPASRPRS